jgi:hypothetical protein
MRSPYKKEFFSRKGAKKEYDEKKGTKYKKRFLQRRRKALERIDKIIKINTISKKPF